MDSLVKMNIDWPNVHAAVWRVKSEKLQPVTRLDPIQLEDLLGVEAQKQALVDNTRRFLNGQRAQHTLLWGSRGTGKSSLIKALLNHFATDGLRMIQLDKNALDFLPELLDKLAERPFHFVIVCDDLSFEDRDVSYKPLKSLLEGGLEQPPENVLLYASSNRRHLLPEQQAENQASRVVGQEVHYTDSLEDKLALSDRFGLWLSFYPPDWAVYFEMIENHLKHIDVTRSDWEMAAKQFATSRASHSGRTARQFAERWQAGLLD